MRFIIFDIELNKIDNLFTFLKLKENSYYLECGIDNL